MDMLFVVVWLCLEKVFVGCKVATGLHKSLPFLIV